MIDAEPPSAPVHIVRRLVACDVDAAGIVVEQDGAAATYAAGPGDIDGMRVVGNAQAAGPAG